MNNNAIKPLMISMLAIAQPFVVAHGASTVLEEIVVTSQKREQRLIDVPMTVHAINDIELERRGIENIQDLSFSVPGVVVREDGPGSQAIYMRGLGNLAGNEALVSVYLDETPVTLGGFEQLDLRTIDLERVEVLKGPQGTLYGQGAVAGTVRFITKSPRTDRFEGNFKTTLSYTKDGEPGQRVTGVVNLPVVEDTFALRLAATVDNSGGWIDQPAAGRKNVNSQDLVNVRAKAQWWATDALTVESTVVVHRNDSDLGLNYSDKDRNIQVGVDRAAKIPRSDDYELYSISLEYDLGDMELISATSYIHNQRNYPNSYITSPPTVYGSTLEGLGFIDAESDQISQEVRLSSTGDGSFDWTVGFYFRDIDQDFLSIDDTLSGGILYSDAVYIADRNSRSYSVFANTSYDLTDRLELGVGIRYFEDEAKLFDGLQTQRETFDSVDPRVYLSYALEDDWNVYASVAKGFRSGGFNLAGLPAFEPETLINYEFGTKMTLLGGAMTADVAVYYSEYKDMLRRGVMLVNNSFLDLTSNIGKVETKGLEGSLIWHVTDAFTINATGSVIDSEVVEVDAIQSAVIKGDPADYVPELSLGLSAVYNFSQFPGFARLDYNYRDEVHVTDRFTMDPDFPTMTSDSISLLGARVGRSWENGARVELFGENLLDETGSVDPYIDWAQAVRLRPRTVGIEIGYDFN